MFKEKRNYLNKQKHQSFILCGKKQANERICTESYIVVTGLADLSRISEEHIGMVYYMIFVVC